ncbi:hypothetical protein EYF80_001091 [Liparis tanakae]|uniref:Uncharacterized protein n=1 Tax=Liparis tanakae TaxID=230148 RepID=A0A4Z2JET2_9TELE|nr:hypothetical protein EYF80_001091 [Liparis tanakae]
MDSLERPQALTPQPPCYQGSLAEGKREGKGEWLHGRRPPPAQLNPTSAARSVFADLKAISAETEDFCSVLDDAKKS